MATGGEYEFEYEVTLTARVRVVVGALNLSDAMRRGDNAVKCVGYDEYVFNEDEAKYEYLWCLEMPAENQQEMTDDD